MFPTFLGNDAYHHIQKVMGIQWCCVLIIIIIIAVAQRAYAVQYKEEEHIMQTKLSKV